MTVITVLSQSSVINSLVLFQNQMRYSRKAELDGKVSSDLRKRPAETKRAFFFFSPSLSLKISDVLKVLPILKCPVEKARM